MSNLSFLRSPHLDTKPKSSSVQLNPRLHRDTNHTFLSSRERLHGILKNAEIHYGLNGFEREIIIFLARFSLDIQSIPCPSFFSFFFPFLLFFFSFLFSSNSHQRANVYIKSRFMAHLVWITVHTFYGSGSQDDILRSSTDRYAMVVYIQKFMYSSPSNASSACHYHHHHRHHHRATRKISSMESFGNYYHFDYISWQLCTRREIEYFERVVIFLQHLKRKMSIYKRMRNWLSKWRGTWLFLWWFLSMRLKLSQGRYNCSIYVRFLLIKWISFV